MPGKSRNALVLGGGSARGFAHVGVVRALEEAGFKPDLVVGCSMGALVGAFYADGVRSHIMRGITRMVSGTKKKASDFIPAKPSASALFDATKIEEFLVDFFGERKIEELSIPFACVAVDIIEGQELVFDSGLVAPAVRASISIPGVFPPLRRGKMIMVDGGLLDPVPVRVARDMGAERVLAVNVISRRKHELRKITLKKPLGVEKKMKLLAEIVDGIESLRDFNIFRLTEKAVLTMESAIVEGSLSGKGAPELVVDVPLEDIGYLEFHRAEEAADRGYQVMSTVIASGPWKDFLK
ncbi:MAG: patatin-like phospholipase family protein [candidate division WOR-3 bacterium]